MRGFQVWLSDGATCEFEATHYEVDAAGELTIWGGSDAVERFTPGSWVEIQGVGLLLSEEWPYPQMEGLMGGIYDLLIGRYGGWVHGLDEERLSDWRINDFDGFLAALLEAASLDPKSTEDRPRGRELRRRIADEFGLRLPPQRRDRRRTG